MEMEKEKETRRNERKKRRGGGRVNYIYVMEKEKVTKVYMNELKDIFFT